MLPGLDLARAMLAQATGDTDAALTRYDALAASHDQFVRARAAVRAVELRLATGKFDTRQAAEALDRLLYAWRGDRRELELRDKLADLRQQLGEWRQALALLRDSEAAFPDDAKAIHARLQADLRCAAARRCGGQAAAARVRRAGGRERRPGAERQRRRGDRQAMLADKSAGARPAEAGRARCWTS